MLAVFKRLNSSALPVYQGKYQTENWTRQQPQKLARLLEPVQHSMPLLGEEARQALLLSTLAGMSTGIGGLIAVRVRFPSCLRVASAHTEASMLMSRVCSADYKEAR